MSTRSPAAILFDVSGNLAVIQSGFPATGTVTGSAPGVMVAGSDGQFARLLRTTTDGSLQVTVNPFVPLVISSYVTTSGSDFTAIRATTFAEMPTGQKRSVASDQTDDYLSGSGARKVMITYYDDQLLGPYYETLFLSGTTAVPTSGTNICYVERMDVVEAGTKLGNVGNISLYSGSSGSGTVMARIAAGDNQTYYSHHYVAANKTACLFDILAYIKGRNGGDVSLRVANPLNAVVPERTVGVQIKLSPGQSQQFTYSVPLQIVGPTRLVFYARPVGTPGLMDWTLSYTLYEKLT